MKKDAPVYGLPLYLLPQDKDDNDPPPPLTKEQLHNFHSDPPLYARIQEVLDDLQDFRLTAEVCRVCRLLKNQEALRKQVQAIYKTAEPTERQLLNVNMQLTSARRRLQENRAYIRISDHFLTLHPSVDDPTVYPMISPPHRLAMPQLHDEPEGHTPSCSKRTLRTKRNPGGKLCFRCQSEEHLSFNCPRHLKYCWHCNSQEHWPNDCLWPAPTARFWCTKCVATVDHKEINCHQYEQCCNCRRRGPFCFLHSHTCPERSSPTPVNDVDADVYDLIDPEA
jgi:hypothetical protein